VASELSPLKLDIWQAGLSRYADLAVERGIEIYQHEAFIELLRGSQCVRMNRSHVAYIRGMLLRFDYYFNAVESFHDRGLDIVDFSSPRYHRLAGFDDFPVYFHSYPEPMPSADAYLDFANLRPGHVVLDLGAYAGMAAIVFSKCVGSAGKVISYEPDPDNFKAATVNVALHARLSGLHNIDLNQYAVWKDCEGIEFSCDGNMGSSASHIVGRRGQVRVVDTITLEDILHVHDLQRVDFLKIDIEGAEIEVIEHSLDLLAKLRPAIVMESHRVENIHSAKECGRLLSTIGYQTWTSDSLSQCSDYLLYARY